LHGFSGPLGLKWRVGGVGAKWGKECCVVDPDNLAFTFGDYYVRSCYAIRQIFSVWDWIPLILLILHYHLLLISLAGVI